MESKLEQLETDREFERMEQETMSENSGPVLRVLLFLAAFIVGWMIGNFIPL